MLIWAKPKKTLPQNPVAILGQEEPKIMRTKCEACREDVEIPDFKPRNRFACTAHPLHVFGQFKACPEEGCKAPRKPWGWMVPCPKCGAIVLLPCL